MNNLYIVINENRQQAGERLRYMTHGGIAGATLEALRLSKKHPTDRFLVMEAKAIGVVHNGKTGEIA